METFATPNLGAVTEHAANTPDAFGAASRQPLLSVRQLEKVFGSRDSITRALAGISFAVEASEFVGIMGPSGSGKTTLLNCISTIDVPTGGRIVVDGADTTALSRRQLARFRRDNLGFVFQDSNLLDTLTGFENIALALSIKHVPARDIPSRVEQVAASLGVADVLKKYPGQMSGGQKQRVAAARAIVAHPKLVLADEPTGALDSRSTKVMLEALDTMNRMLSATIMMVTHDAYAASYSSRVLFIKDGRLFNEVRRGNTAREDFFKRILEVVAFLGGSQGHAA